jgi:hypothetical protein
MNKIRATINLKISDEEKEIQQFDLKFEEFGSSKFSTLNFSSFEQFEEFIKTIDEIYLKTKKIHDNLKGHLNEKENSLANP